MVDKLWGRISFADRLKSLQTSLTRQGHVWGDILILLGAIPLMGILLLLFLQWSSVVSPMGQIIWSGLSIGLAFVLFPIVYLRRRYQVKLTDIGIQPVRLTKLSLQVLVLITGGLVLSQLYQDKQMLRFVLLQNVAVAIGEEVLFRGCLTYLLLKIFPQGWLAHVISGLLFVFVLHSGAGLIENLIFRLPITALLVAIYRQTNDLKDTITLHWLYNIAASAF